MSKIAALIIALLALFPAYAAPPSVNALIANKPEVENWNTFGPGQMHWRKRENAVQGGVALRVDIDAKQKNPWDIRAQALTSRNIQKNDKLLFAFWARNTGATPIPATVQRIEAPYPVMGNARLTIGPEWKLYCVAGTANVDVKKGKFAGVLQIGTAKQTLELGPAFLLAARTAGERRLIATGCSGVESALAAYPIAPPSIAALKTKLEKILADTHTPGVSLALVRKNGPEWIAGLGKAEVAHNVPADADSLFRIGSTSKNFVAFSILKLAHEGKLSLQDPLHKLAPEIWFENKWEATDPVRVVDLMAHTTGWDDLAISDYVDAKGHYTDLGKQLDLLRASRVSRWRPGTRMSYSNMGPVVAAYIVEKITHQRFEDYVAANFFKPMGMNSATYFPPDPKHAATLYHFDGKTPFTYWYISGRPAGSINASAKDMARLVQLFLDRGTLDGREIMPASAIVQMETPTRNWAAEQGSPTGYGLANYTSVYGGRVWHGHNGGVMGGITEMAYLPDEGVGYFFSINSGNGAAFSQIGDALRDYLSLDIPPRAMPKQAALPADASDYAGWYEPASVRNGIAEGMERLLGLGLVRVMDGTLVSSSLGDWKRVLLPVSGRLLRRDDTPVATIVLVPLQKEGRFIQFGMGNTMMRIPAWQAIVELFCMAWLVLAFASIILYAPFWMIWGLWKKHRKPAERWLKLWPLLALIAFAASIGFGISAGEDAVERLGNPTIWSVGLWLGTIVFAIASIAALVSVWLARGGHVRRFVYAYSAAVSLALVIATAYLAYWGRIGMPTWM